MESSLARHRVNISRQVLDRFPFASFFTDVQVKKAANFAEAVTFGALFFKAPNPQHLTQQDQSMFAFELFSFNHNF